MNFIVQRYSQGCGYEDDNCPLKFGNFSLIYAFEMCKNYTSINSLF